MLVEQKSNLTINIFTRTITDKNENHLYLTSKEFDLLYFLYYLKQEGVIDVHYIKHTHRQKKFNAVKEGELPVRLTRNIGQVTYVLYWVLKSEEAPAKVSKLGVEKYYKRWN